jgi:hypothetical protein
MARGKNWCFTLNNYSEEEYKEILNTDCGYIIIGKEVGENGTPHLQGYIQMKITKRLTGMKKINDKAHWEQARGTPEENRKYCSKEKNFEEKGSISNQGKKKVDMVKAVVQTLKGVPIEKLIEEHGAGYIMHRKKINEVAKDMKSEAATKMAKEEYKDANLIKWQEEVIEKLENQNDRKILFVVDKKGGRGKTWLSSYIEVNYDTLALQNCKTQDGAYMFDGQEYILFDLTRSNLEVLNYDLMERLKNGKITSTKYECKRIFRKSTKMVVFMNEEPDKTKLSEDRWDIYDLDKEIEENPDLMMDAEKAKQKHILDNLTFDSDGEPEQDLRFIEGWE